MLLIEYIEKKKEELEKSIHPTYNNAIKNYIKLKIEILDWFLNLLTIKKSDITTSRILIKDRIRYYENEKNSKDIQMAKMVEYNDRIKCFESLLHILSNYEENNDNIDPEELISIFD